MMIAALSTLCVKYLKETQKGSLLNPVKSQQKLDTDEIRRKYHEGVVEGQQQTGDTVKNQPIRSAR
jgi:hypothetical protein